MGNQVENGKSREPAPFEYYCFSRPIFDILRENDEKKITDRLNDDMLFSAQREELEGNSRLCDKRGVDLPGHKWINMRVTGEIVAEYQLRATYTNPSNFGMYIYNDFHGYGLLELVENLLVAFNKEFKKKVRDEVNLKQMWAVVAAMAHCLNEDEFEPWISCEDGDRIQQTVRLIGSSVLSSLNVLDLEGMLQADSEIKDLGLVLSLYLEWSHDLTRFGVSNKALEWRKETVAYARKAGIDFKAVGCYQRKKNIDPLEEVYGNIGFLEGAARIDRWAWKKNFGILSRPGGQRFNILRMSRDDRAKYSFTGEDPLKDFTEKELHEGLVPI